MDSNPELNGGKIPNKSLRIRNNSSLCFLLLETMQDETVLWIRIPSDQDFLLDPNPEKIIKDPGSSGSEMNLKYNYSDKLINFATK